MCWSFGQFFFFDLHTFLFLLSFVSFFISFFLDIFFLFKMIFVKLHSQYFFFFLAKLSCLKRSYNFNHVQEFFFGWYFLFLFKKKREAFFVVLIVVLIIIDTFFGDVFLIFKHLFLFKAERIHPFLQ